MRMLRVLLAVAAMALAAPAQTRLVFCTDATFPPMEFLDANKRLAGFDVELIQAVAKAAGFEAVVRNASWDGIFAGLAAGEYDGVISSVTATPERKATLDFSAPYVSVGQVIIVNRSTRGLTTLAQFGGRKVGVQIGTTGAFEVVKHPGIQLKSYDEAGLAVEDLAIGRIDAVVVDSPTAANFVLRNPRYQAKLMIVGAPFTSEQYCVAFRKGNRKAVDLVNKGLAAVLKDGTVERLSAKWLK